LRAGDAATVFYTLSLHDALPIFDPAADPVAFAGMSYVLKRTKQQQVLGLGRPGWSVSRIAAATAVDRATVARYLRAAGCRCAGVDRKSTRLNSSHQISSYAVFYL